MLLAGWLLLALGAHAGTTHYVNQNSPATAPPYSSWATAAHTVQAALNVAASGSEVWVAAGTYEGTLMLASGVALYGGFAGSESSLDQRDWTLNETILDAKHFGRVVTVATGAAAGTRLDGFTITGGSAPQGGGIYAKACSGVTFANNTITGNTTTGSHGGGVFCTGSSLTLTGNTISGNATAPGFEAYGGGMYADGSSLTLVGNVISANTAMHGGGLFCGNNPILQMDANVIQDNDAQYWGGGIFYAGLGGALTGNTIAGNTAGWSGGGVFLSYSSQSTLSGNTLSGNTAAFEGGGVYGASGSASTLVDNTLSGNTANDGGGILLDLSTAIWTGNTIADNTATRSGGGAFIRNSHVDIVDQRISGNEAGVGGGAYVGHGGGVYIEAGAVVTVAGSIIADNAVGYSGGALLVDGGCTVTVSNSLLSGNYADEYGAAVFTGGIDSVTTFVNCTLAGNLNAPTAFAQGGVLFVFSGAAILQNSIVAFNSSGLWRCGWGGAASLSLNHCSVYGNPDFDLRFEGAPVTPDPIGTDGNLAEDPLFANATAGNWRLTNVSPCVNTGSNAFVTAGATDADGLSRVIHDGGTVDMGAYELRDAPPVALGQTIATPEDTATAVVLAAWDVDNAPLTYTVVTGPAHGTLSGSAPNLVYTPVPGYCGSDLFTFLAHDGTAPSTAAVVALTVTPVNDPPEVTGLTVSAVCAGRDARLTAALADVDDATLTVTIDWGDGTAPESVVAGTGSFSATHVYAASGDFTVTFEAHDAGGLRAGAEATVDVPAAEPPGTVHYVNGDSPAPAYPYLSWGTAARTVQAAINVAGPGSAVWVAAGTYETTLTLLSGVALYGGFAGSESSLGQRDWTLNQTILDARQLGRVVTVASGAVPGTRIDGFTITGGTASSGGGISAYQAAVAIANNVIEGNRATGASDTNGAGGGCDLRACSEALVMDNQIRNNEAVRAGGLFLWLSPLSVANNTFTGNRASHLGGAMYINSSAATLVGNTFTANTCPQAGGLYVLLSTGFTMRGNTITGNTATATNAGGIRFQESAGVFEDNTVTYNTAANGAGIDIATSPGGLILRHNVISANQAEYGAGVNSTDSAATLAGNTISGNAASACGGGLSLGNSSLALTGNTISDNTAGAAGGGLFLTGSSPTLTNNAISGNAAAGVGGGVYMEFAATVAIANGTFLDNISGTHGGALAVAAGCKARVEGCLFRGNQAMFYGGAVHAIGSGSETTAVNCTFDDNGAGPGTDWGAYGGALLIEQAAVLSLTHSVLRGNAAVGAGGALSVYAATAQIVDCLLEDNAADWYGGAASLTDASVTITGSIIRGNRTDYAGGALSVIGGCTVLAADSLLSGNHAGEYGGAIFMTDGLPVTTLINCTVAGNTVATTNGVIFVNSGTATLENSLVAANSSGIWPTGWAGAATVSMSYSCVYGNANYDVMNMDDPTGVDGNLSLDPRFADPGAGDWRLQPDSPCAEAGDNALAYGTVDLDGNPRILPSLGGTVDMGAYEALRHSPKAADQALSTLEDTALGITLTATDADGEALTYSVVSQPAHGTLSGSAPDLTYTPAQDYNGSDSFTFRANDGALDSNTATVAITVTAVNDAPILAAIGGKAVDEEAVLSFTVAASDPADGPADGLTCTAAGLPEGATFEPGTGVFTWTPTEAQQGTFAVTFTVTDDGTPSLSISETVTITVAEVNDAPMLAPIGARSVVAGALLSFTVTASDPNDVPANALTLSAAGLPAGAAFDPASGAFAWSPTEAQGGTAYTVTITVTDDGTNPAAQSDSETFTITVKRDSDGDGLADVDEVDLYGTDPNAADTDGDGLGDGAEVNTYSTDPLTADSDGDGQSDGDEVACGSNPLNGLVLAADIDGDALPDCMDDDDDGDGLSDDDEADVYGTDPLDADSDDDGIADGDEVAMLGYSIFGSDTDDALHIEEFAEIAGNAVGVGEVDIGKDATIERDVCSLGRGVQLNKGAFVGGSIVATGKLELDNSAVVGGDVTSRDEVRIKQDATVAGNATSAGRVVLHHRAVVEGTITEYATIAPATTIPPVDFTVVPGTVDISVKRKRCETLLPGSYRKLKVENGGAITLTAGVYVFAEVEVGHGAVVYLDLNGGTLLVDVLGDVGFRDRVRTILLGAEDRAADVLVRAAGDDVTLGKEGCYVGTFLAPHGGIGLGDDAALNGALYARTVKAGKGARLAFAPALRLYVDLFVH